MCHSKLTKKETWRRITKQKRQAFFLNVETNLASFAWFVDFHYAYTAHSRSLLVLPPFEKDSPFLNIFQESLFTFFVTQIAFSQNKINL